MEDREYDVRVTAYALKQSKRIRDYICYQLNAPGAAFGLIEKIERSMASLSRFPHRFAVIEKEPWRSDGIHRMTIENYCVYFWIDEDKKQVQVTAILFGKRDQVKQLYQMSIE